MAAAIAPAEAPPTFRIRRVVAISQTDLADRHA